MTLAAPAATVVLIGAGDAVDEVCCIGRIGCLTGILHTPVAAPAGDDINIPLLLVGVDNPANDGVVATLSGALRGTVDGVEAAAHDVGVVTKD